MIEILDPGPCATVQDLGREGYAALGVPRSGAFDRAAAQLANRLVGNPTEAALLEVTLGGLTLRALDATTLALSGAPCPSAIGWGAAHTLSSGSILRLGAPPEGLRSYLAVRGGLRVPAVLGSCSTDLLSGLGPDPLRPGDLLAVGAQPEHPVLGAAAAHRRRRSVTVWPGPRADWFEPGALELLSSTPWQVRPDSDRIGVRLDGPPLRRARTGELSSEAMLPGSVQVPPDGRPILFGPDAPVTGGYPVIAVADDLDPAAQWRPGDIVSFRLA